MADHDAAPQPVHPLRIVFVSGVTLGHYALRGMLGSQPFRNGTQSLAALFTLEESRGRATSGFQQFDALADQIGAPIHHVASMKTAASLQLVRDYAPDLIFVIGWSELIPTALLDIPRLRHGTTSRHGPRHGCIGMHPTLLPLGRGRAPIPWAIIKGLEKSGVTMFYLEEDADAGDIIAQREFAIEPDDDASTVYNKVAELHFQIMRDTTPLLLDGTAPRIPQDDSIATVWPKRRPQDGLIDWSRSRREVHDWVRAQTHPYPGAFTFRHGQKLVVWKACLGCHDLSGPPGTILTIDDEGIAVACGDGALWLENVQLQDEQPLPASAFAARYGVAAGDVLTSPS